MVMNLQRQSSLISINSFLEIQYLLNKPYYEFSIHEIDALAEQLRIRTKISYHELFSLSSKKWYRFLLIRRVGTRKSSRVVFWFAEQLDFGSFR